MTLEDAYDLAADFFNGGPADSKIGIFAFTSGYVAWHVQEEPAGPAELPAIAGGGCIVIDKDSGEVVLRPLLEPETVAARYLAEHPTT